MGARMIANKLTDLLPDVLIEAQRCDRITAEKALFRTAEELAYDHGFFRVWLRRKYTDETERVCAHFGPLCSGRVFHTDDASVLRVLGGMIDGRPYCGPLQLEDGRILAFGEVWRDGGGEVAFLVNVIPLMDEAYADPATLTRDRNVLIYGTLADLLAMPGKPWADEARAGLYRLRFQEALESWKTRQVLGWDGAGPLVTRNPFGFL